MVVCRQDVSPRLCQLTGRFSVVCLCHVTGKRVPQGAVCFPQWLGQERSSCLGASSSSQRKNSALGDSDSGPAAHFLQFCSGGQSLQQPLGSPACRECARQRQRYTAPAPLLSAQIPVPLLKLGVAAEGLWGCVMGCGGIFGFAQGLLGDVQGRNQGQGKRSRCSGE